MEAFVNNYVKPSLSTLDEAKAQLASGAYHNFLVTQWVENNISNIQEDLGRSVQSLIDDATLGQFEIDDPTLTYLGEVHNLIIEDVFEIDTERVYIEISFEAEVGIDIFIEKSDYYGCERYPFPITVWDEDWNDYYVWATTSIENIPISLTLVFNVATREPVSFEANFRNFFGLCKECGNVIGSDAAETCPNCGKQL